MSTVSDLGKLEGRSVVTLVVARGLSTAWSLLEPSLPTAHSPLLLLPNTLDADDGLTAFVQSMFRPKPKILVPAASKARVIAMATGHAIGFIRLNIRAAGTGLGSVRLPNTLLARAERWAVVDVQSAAATGPFVLDLVARHAHPRDWTRLVAARDRADLAVEVNLAAAPSAALIAADTVRGYFLAFTTDLIAAELLSLSLAEMYLQGSPSLAGPWEDRVVQRATELELGVRIPDDISVHVILDDALSEQGVISLISTVCERFGVASRFASRMFDCDS